MDFEIVLDNIIPHDIERKFNITIDSDISKLTDDVPYTVTKISDLESETISFQDNSKKIHTCKISMIDYNSQCETDSLDYNCFWCRHSFDTKGIGCPINYVPNTIIKEYFSEISRGDYVIKEHITKNKKTKLNMKRKNYYISDGIFCSFNCVLAFINDRSYNKLYDQSKTLIHKILKEITTDETFEIDPAPHWRLLNKYGGYMSIEEFRNSFNKSYFEEYGMIQKTPLFRSLGWIYEEKLKF